MTASLGWAPGSEVDAVAWDRALSLPVPLPGVGAEENRFQTAARSAVWMCSLLALIRCEVVVRYMLRSLFYLLIFQEFI